MKFLWFCLGPNKHQSAVTCLQFNKNFVITSSDDGTVKLWDLKTGEFIRNLVTLESGGSGGVVWRIRASNTKLVCAVGSRNGTEETKLLVLDFDVDMKWGAGKGALSPCIGDRLPALPPAKEKKRKKKKKKYPLFSVVQDVGLGQQSEKTYRRRRKRGGDDRPQLTGEAPAGSSRKRLHVGLRAALQHETFEIKPGAIISLFCSPVVAGQRYCWDVLTDSAGLFFYHWDLERSCNNTHTVPSGLSHQRASETKKVIFLEWKS